LLLLLPWLLNSGCGSAADPVTIGEFILSIEEGGGAFSIEHDGRGDRLQRVMLKAGTGTADIEMSFGSFRFDDEEADLVTADSYDMGDATGGAYDTGVAVPIQASDDDGNPLGTLTLTADTADTLQLSWLPDAGGTNRVKLSADCDGADHFMGLGSHAMDVDHVGQAFPLWVSEPGIGKLDTELYPDDWFMTGTRHASSYPVPFLLRPHQAHGLFTPTTARVEVDLCARDTERFDVTIWDDHADFLLISGDGPLQVVQTLTDYTGRLDLPPAWAFAPWNDAVRGTERVTEVADLLRESGAASSVIWTEDFKGADESLAGYHISGEWILDEEMYPDATTQADTLERQGFKWFAYFSPFVIDDTETWDMAVEADVLIQDPAGGPYIFKGATFHDTSMVDLTTDAGRDWARELMTDILDAGFDGWMADYAEWLPVDAQLDSGEDAMRVHNSYPALWQSLNNEVIESRDATYFSRSGWGDALGVSPIVWAGDQRTSFDGDDGFPTVIPLGLGLSACGVAVYTHDIAGYQSQGNAPSTQELWYRWASLGAYSPIMRTHHGASDVDNWQFDTDAETTAYWAQVTREHMRLFPYRYGLAYRAAQDGTPMILPTSFLFGGEDWGRMDAWMLGDALLVAPVLEAGVTGREVSLPEGVSWYEWNTLSPASGGWVEAGMKKIPVFAAAGTTVPVFDIIPDTLVEAAEAPLLNLDDVDHLRTVYLFGGGGEFTEGDGTSYRPTGTPTGDGETEVTLTSGTAEVAGVAVEIDGPRERTYRLIVVD